jgi:hypothetical protein
MVNSPQSTHIKPPKAIWEVFLYLHPHGNYYLKNIGDSKIKTVARANIHKVDVLASWNFKHIVNLDRIKGYNAMNSRLGYSILEIRSPKDLMYYGND